MICYFRSHFDGLVANASTITSLLARYQYGCHLGDKIPDMYQLNLPPRIEIAFVSMDLHLIYGHWLQRSTHGYFKLYLGLPHP